MAFPDLANRVAEVRERIDRAAATAGRSQAVTIVAVTKTYGPEAVDSAAAVGLDDVGENRVQEALDKMASATASVRWHLIGHLQRNKAKAALRFNTVQSVDSWALAERLSAFATETGRRLRSFVQVNVVGEATKGGFEANQVAEFADRLHSLQGLDVAGVMTMAPLDANESTLRRVFGGARSAAEVLRSAGHAANELSMGMSNDFEIAVEEGATVVRLGTILFGARTA